MCEIQLSRNSVSGRLLGTHRVERRQFHLVHYWLAMLARMSSSILCETELHRPGYEVEDTFEANEARARSGQYRPQDIPQAVLTAPQSTPRSTSSTTLGARMGTAL